MFGAAWAPLVVDDPSLGEAGRGHAALHALDQCYVLGLGDLVDVADRLQLGGRGLGGDPKGSTDGWPPLP